MNYSTVAALAVLMAASVSQSQPAAPIAPLATSGSAVLRVGTEVPLRLSEQLTTKEKQLRVGQRFHMEVAEAVSVNGVVVIPVGSPAMGEVTDVRNKGMWGKSGHLSARILYVEVNGRQIRLSGTFDDKGTTGTAGVVAAIAFVPIAGFLTTGTSANIAAGSSVKGFVDEDVPLNFAVTAPVPLTVGAPAPALAVAAPVPAAPALTVAATTPAAPVLQKAVMTTTAK